VTGPDVLHYLVTVDPAPVIKDIADHTGGVDKPHVVLASLVGGAEAAILQLERLEPIHHALAVHPREIVAQDHQGGQGGIRVGRSGIVIGNFLIL